MDRKRIKLMEAEKADTYTASGHTSLFKRHLVNNKKSMIKILVDEYEFEGLAVNKEILKEFTQKHFNIKKVLIEQNYTYSTLTITINKEIAKFDAVLF